MKKRWPDLKWFGFLLGAVLFFLLLGQAAFAPAARAADISIVVDGNQLATDVSPYVQDDRVLVPFRALFEALGATVSWDAGNQVVTGTKEGREVRLTIGSRTAYVNGKPVELDVPAAITGDRTFVPLRFVAESLGAEVGWDNASQTVRVSLGSAAPAGSAPPAGTSSKTISITDSYGNKVNVPSPPGRIVTSNANVAQAICALGAADSIVGVSNTTVFPPVLKGKEKIGPAFTFDSNKVISLKPDIFFCYSTQFTKQELIDKVKRAGIPVVMLDCYKLDTMEQDMTTLGRILGREQAAAEFNSFVKKYLDLIGSRVGNLPASKKPLVYYESYSDYNTVGPGSSGLALIEAAGGRNAANEFQVPYPKPPQISAEWVVAKNPQFIFKQVSSSSLPVGYGGSVNSMITLRKDLMGRPGWSKIDAVKSGKVYVFSDQIGSSPSAVVGVAYFAKWLHPGLFKDLDPAAINREILKKFYGLEPEGAWVYPEE
jgi:iron complex transport system substrate-binding protein